MSRPTLLVIDPSVESPETEGLAELGHGFEGEVLTRLPGLEPNQRCLPELLEQVDGLVLMGSAASVHDDTDLRRELVALVDPVLSGERPIPMLAICYGHQLVAQLRGGTVGAARADRSKVFGVEETRLDGSRLVPGQERVRHVVSHYEAVTVPPPGYRVVGNRPELPHDVLEHETLPIFSFQGHVEARREFLESRGRSSEEVDGTLVSDCRAVIDAFHELVQAR
ncbi:MAG: hypothetical protein AAF533_23735 [Acidobacteriota bacterium]